MIFRVHVFLGPGFSGSRFFKVWVQGLGPGFRSSQDNQVYVTEQNPTEPHSLVVLFKVYL